MSETTTAQSTRKAVVTTNDVQNAVNRYETVRQEISGVPAQGLLFDKGARGKGFALYNPKDEVVETFGSKEEALNKFVTWVEVATEVSALISAKTPVKAPGKTAAKAPEAPSA